MLKSFRDLAAEILDAENKGIARHHELLILNLERVCSGACSRLMVQMPPGSAKSTYGSVFFPAYFLAKHRRASVIATSHTFSLAQHFGRQVRSLIAEHANGLGIKLDALTRASSNFSTDAGGQYFACGVRGPITGRRADLIIIDDPIKSWAEAESRTYRDAIYDWYRAELIARLKPEGRVVFIMTRWHEDDLAGRLMATDPSWNCLRLPELAEANDPLGRAEGEVLWPDWHGAADVARRRQEVGERTFQALYQQNPKALDKSFFDVGKIALCDEAPDLERTIRAWDLASGLPGPGRNPDFTVGLKLGADRAGQIYVLDVIRIRVSPAAVEDRICQAAAYDGIATIIALPQDPGQAGAAQISMLSRKLAGYNVTASTEKGPKPVRAMAAATQIDAGRLSIVSAPWNDAFLAELRGFPDVEKDDQVDALSRAINMFIVAPTPARRIDVALFGR